MTLSEFPKMKRRATHAGVWYSDSPAALDKELSRWLENVPSSALDTSGNEVSLTEASSRVIIAPHAGYAYSGPTAAYSYASLKTSSITTVFILGPSHHYFLQDCSLTKADEYETPFGALKINKKIVAELESSQQFSKMSRSVDEEEHSIEMHLPFIHKVFGPGVSLVPILVGNLSSAKETAYGNILARYLQDPQVVFVVSSDFCHWGQRFRYVYRASQDVPLWQSIEKLDKEAMLLVEKGDPKAFEAYLKRTGNTICGRHPVAVILNAIRSVYPDPKDGLKLCCIHYDQSSRCEQVSDSSVSYVAAISK